MKRIKTYWLLLLVLVYTGTAVLSVGQTQARYVNTASWDTVLDEAEDMVTSDLLQRVGGQDVTILLGDMPQKAYDIPITLESSADVEGELTWEVKQPGYLTVEMSVDNTAQAMDELETYSEEKENVIRLEAGKPLTIKMRLIPEKDIFTTPRDAKMVFVTVRWGNSLQGSFMVKFPEVVEEPEETEPEETEPEETEPEETESEVSEPEETEPEVTEPEETEPEVTEPEETEPEVTEPEATEPEVTEPEVTEPEVTEPEVTEPEVTEPEATEPEATEPETTLPDATDPKPSDPEPTDPAPTDPIPTDGIDQNQVLTEASEKDPTEETSDAESEENDEPAIPENSTEPEPTESGEEAAVISEEEPAADETGTESQETEEDGKSGVIGGLEDFIDNNNQDGTDEEDGTDSDKDQEDDYVPGDPIELNVKADERFDADSRLSVKIVPPNDVNKLQFGIGIAARPVEGSDGEPQIELSNFPRFLCYSYDGGAHYYMLYKAGIIEVVAEPKRTLPLLLDFSRTKIEGEELTIAVSGLHNEYIVGSGSAVVSVEPQERVQLESRFLSDQEPLRIEIPETWKDYTSEVDIEMLTCVWDEEGTAFEMVHRPVDAEKIGLKLETEKETGALILRIDDILPPAGTYRISINWIHEEKCVAKMQESFFINYLAYHKAVETGGAEQ